VNSNGRLLPLSNRKKRNFESTSLRRLRKSRKDSPQNTNFPLAEISLMDQTVHEEENLFWTANIYFSGKPEVRYSEGFFDMLFAMLENSIIT
jgi:hypothetical protein